MGFGAWLELEICEVEVLFVEVEITNCENDWLSSDQRVTGFVVTNHVTRIFT